MADGMEMLEKRHLSALFAGSQRTEGYTQMDRKRRKPEVVSRQEMISLHTRSQRLKHHPSLSHFHDRHTKVTTAGDNHLFHDHKYKRCDLLFFNRKKIGGRDVVKEWRMFLQGIPLIVTHAQLQQS